MSGRRFNLVRGYCRDCPGSSSSPFAMYYVITHHACPPCSRATAFLPSPLLLHPQRGPGTPPRHPRPGRRCPQYVSLALPCPPLTACSPRGHEQPMANSRSPQKIPSWPGASPCIPSSHTPNSPKSSFAPTTGRTSTVFSQSTSEPHPPS